MTFQNLSNFSDDQLKAELERRNHRCEITPLKVNVNREPLVLTFAAPAGPGHGFGFLFDGNEPEVIGEDDMRRLADWIIFKLEKLKSNNTTMDREMAERYRG